MTTTMTAGKLQTEMKEVENTTTTTTTTTNSVIDAVIRELRTYFKERKIKRNQRRRKK